MAKKKHILVCRSGAKLMMSEDGSLAYMGGDAYAIGVNEDTRFEELKSEMADMWKFERSSITVKYLLPNTSSNLVTISTDRDIRNMLEFYEDSTTVDVYVFTSTSNATSNVSTTPAIRSKRTKKTVENVSPPGGILSLPGRVIGADQVPRSDVLSRPERVIGADQVPRSDVLSHPERVIGADQVPRSDVLSRPDQVIGADQVPRSDVLSRPERVTGADQVPCSDVLSRPERVIGIDQVPRSDVLSRPERVIGVDQVPRSDVLSHPERVIGVDQVLRSDVLSRPERVIGADQVPRSDVLSRPERVNGVDQVARSDVQSRPRPEPLNELAVYSESEMLKNSKESERFRLAKLWENCLTGVQQQFNSANDFRDTLRKYSVARGFTCIKTENNSNQFSGKCKGKGCPWEIRASKLATSKHFVVRKLNDIHTCGAKRVSST
ncbi:PB1 domain-containing protein [Heracleum sosnowskyi]|uniref:PB1 domain-containing protein n=1 Tax=Heracleum sosnowskyi TaxID=360622 RepID=A0AAD8GUD0_9APIA|nr:PB1 domain-containing protein [Heracleum sosnowskyi]